LKLSIERGGGFVAGVESACLSREVLPLGRPAASRRACTCLKLSVYSNGRDLRTWRRLAHRRLLRQPSLSFGKGSASFSPQRSQPPAPRRGPLTERLTQTRRPASKPKPPPRRLLAVVGALHRRLFSQLLEFFPKRLMGRWPCPGQCRRGV
jgi:hypothetical protein